MRSFSAGPAAITALRVSGRTPLLLLSAVSALMLAIYFLPGVAALAPGAIRASLRGLALAWVLGSAGCVLRALRCQYALGTEEVQLPTAFAAITTAGLGNWLLPARAGDVWRILILSRRSGLSKPRILAMLLAEKTIDVAVLLAIGLAAAGASTAVLPVDPRVRIGAAGVVVLVIAFAVAVLLLGTKKCGNEPKVSSRWHSTREALIGAATFFHTPAKLCVFLSLTVLVWLAETAAVIAVASSLALAMPLSVVLLTLSVMGIAASLPFATGALATSQIIVVSLMVPAGFTMADSVQYVFLAQGLGLAVVLVWGGLSLMDACASAAVRGYAGMPTARRMLNRFQMTIAAKM